MDPSITSNFTFFDFKVREGCSQESFPFYSSLCISNNMQFIFHLCYIVINSLVAAFIATLLVIEYWRNKNWSVPCHYLFLSTCLSLALLLAHLAYFFGVTGFLFHFLFSLGPTAALVSISYLLLKWYQVIISNHMTNKEELIIKLNRLYICFNVIYPVIFVPLCVAAGSYGFENIGKHNVLMGCALFWMGFCTMTMGMIVFWGGLKIKVILNETLKFDSNRLHQVSKAINKVHRFTQIQSFMYCFGGIAELAFGLWGIFGRYKTHYIYYLFMFNLYTCGVVVCLIFAYLAVGTRKKVDTGDSGSQSKSSGSKSKEKIALAIS